MRSHAKAASAKSAHRFSSCDGSRRRLVLLAALVLAALVSLAAVAPAAPLEYLTSFGPDGTESSDFELVNSVAVDHQTGHVYVLDSKAGALYKFDAEGQPVDWGGGAVYITGNRIGGISPHLKGPNNEVYGLAQVAVDPQTHLVYVTEKHAVRAFDQNGEPAELTAGPGAGTSEIPGFSQLRGLAVDVNGSIYASDAPGTISIYASTGAPITTVATTEPANLAVATNGVLYVAPDFDTAFKKLTPDTFPVTGSTVYTESEIKNPIANHLSIGVGVDPVTDDVYEMVSDFGTSWIRKYDSAGNFVRSWGEPGTPSDDEGFGSFIQGIATLGAGKELQLYVGHSEKFESPNYSKVDIFGPNIVEGPPAIKSTSVLAVTADSATLRAQINPNTAETTYRFEYGLEDCAVSACTSIPIDGDTIAAGFEPVTVTESISGLQASTTYHYRVVAENSFGLPVEGPDATFTTQTPGLGFQLADSRAWEMVSPPDKHGAQLVGSALGLVQAADDGNGLVYPSRGSIEADPDGSRSFEVSTVLARRGSATWRSKDITPPNAHIVPVSANGQYGLFTPDLSRAVLEQRDRGPLSPQASERTPYLRENTEPPKYTPLVTGKEGFANVPPGTKFGGSEESWSEDIRFLGANPSFSHVVFKSTPSLAEGAPEKALYLWNGGQLAPVSTLPVAEGGSTVQATVLGSGLGTTQNAISADGSRIFWAPGDYGASGNALTALYLRDTVAEETVRLDVPQAGVTPSGLNRPAFQGANEDGTVVFFSDSRQLTADASPSGRDLYRCEIPPGSAPSGCGTLTDISAALPGSGESAEVQGLASGVSEDGRRIYFVAKGVLDTVPNQHGESAEAGGFNLYLWEEGEGVRFIANLTGADDAVWGWGSSTIVGYTSTLNAAVSPSGRYLSFMSQRSLTGYANFDAKSGEPVQEVFRYDAITDQVDCVSCNPSGAAPEGREESSVGQLVDPRSLWGGRWLAAVLPQSTILGIEYPSPYRSRSTVDNGRVFFNAIDSLVPADSNGQWDVYQWEPTGVGHCTSTSGGAAIMRSAGGCVSLISSGTAEEEAGFLDASESGDDVFFLTPARLTVTDEDEELDVYDARVNGVPATLSPRGECQGEACQPPAIPPADFTPASAFFEGQGNLRSQGSRRCAKGKRKVRRRGKVRCVARKPVRKQQRKAKAGQGRRAAR